MITVLRLENFYPISDEMLDTILENCNRIEDLTLISCGLRNPTIPLQSVNDATFKGVTTIFSRPDIISPLDTRPRFKKSQSYQQQLSELSSPRSRSNSATTGFMRCLNLSYCEIMSSIIFSNRGNAFEENLVELTLTGTMIDDVALADVLDRLQNLRILDLRECRHLISPIIRQDSMEHLNLRFCRNLTCPVIQCPRLETLDLSFTAVTDHIIKICVTEQRTSSNLRVLMLSNCPYLQNPVFVKALMDHENEEVQNITGTSIPKNEHFTQFRTSTSSNDSVHSDSDSESEIFPSLKFTCYEQLEELFLDCCPQLSHPTIRVPSLKHIDLRITKRLEQNTIFEVQEAHPNITHLLTDTI
jgi:hypothetical protein